MFYGIWLMLTRPLPHSDCHDGVVLLRLRCRTGFAGRLDSLALPPRLLHAFWPQPLQEGRLWTYHRRTSRGEAQEPMEQLPDWRLASVPESNAAVRRSPRCRERHAAAERVGAALQEWRRRLHTGSAALQLCKLHRQHREVLRCRFDASSVARCS